MLRERDADIGALRAAVRGAAAGDGQAVAILGEGGIGKTSLLSAARDEAREAGLRVLRARATEFEQDFPFGVVHQLLDAVVDGASGEELDRWFGGAAALARGVLTGGVAAPGQGPDLFPLLHGLYWMVNALARDRPVAVLVDDVQWADAPSLAMLSFLGRRAEETPIAVVVASRPPHQPRPELTALLEDPDAVRVEPRPLSEAAVRDWLDDELPERPDGRFVAACADTTGGNPFYLREVIRNLVQQDVTPTGEAAHALASATPDTVATAIGQRLDRLGDRARKVAAAIAVLDAEATPVRLARLTGADAGPPLDELVAAGFIGAQLPPAFSHPLVRSAVYASLGVFERDELHRAAVELLTADGAATDVVAAHLLQVAPRGDEATVAQLRRAAAHASELGAAPSALRYLRRALAEPPPPAELGHVLLELGRAAAAAGEPDGESLLARARELAETEDDRVEAAIALARVQKLTGRALPAAEVLEPLAPSSPAARLELLMLAYAGVAARDQLSSWRTRLTAPPVVESELDLVSAACLGFDAVASRLSRAEGVALARRATTLRPLPVDPAQGVGYGTLLANVSLLWSDELTASRELTEAVLAETRRAARPLAMASTIQQSALVAMSEGDLAQAAADAHEAIRYARFFPTLALLAVAHATALLAAVERDAPAAELTVLEDALSAAALDPDALPHVLVHYARGRSAHARGDDATALAEFLAAGQHALSWDAPNPSIAPWRSWAARMHDRLGEADRADELVDDELRLARSFGAPRCLGIALIGAAAVRPSDAVDLLREAVDVLSGSGARLEYGRALVGYGRALRLARRAVEAREPLALGRELASRCGAEGLAEHARTELLASGARPRRLAVSGVNALTPSERRVSSLAASGQTNRAIAQHLFISERTVENHLGRAFAKLGVASRGDLPTDLLVAAS